MVSKPIQQHEK
jgi:hypothetical protein